MRSRCIQGELIYRTWRYHGEEWRKKLKRQVEGYYEKLDRELVYRLRDATDPSPLF